MRPIDYIRLHKDLSNERKRGIANISDFLSSQKNEKDLPPQNNLEIDIVKSSDKSVEFIFRDFDIYIEFVICTTKEIGFIKWFNRVTDLEGQSRMVPVSMDSFDRCGDIKVASFNPERSSYSFGSNLEMYVIRALMTFCEKVDLAEFEKTTTEKKK